MILGYSRPDYLDYGLKLPRRLTLDTSTAHMLVAGKSGSGKSLSMLWYIYQLLKGREAVVYVADYKGGAEYEALEGASSYASGSRAFDLIEDYYQFFTAVRDQHVRLDRHFTLVIEEWLGLLTYAETQSKKLRSEIMAKIGEILAVGRGLNIGVVLCVQRADASLFSNGAREQFQAVICFGRTSSEHFRMLGFSAELEDNPTGAYKPGQALCLVDGQDAPVEIIVPYVRDQAAMGRVIRFHLDNQQRLDASLGTHGGAGRPEQHP